MTGRSSFVSKAWRVLRWAGLAAAVPAVWACTSRTLEAPVVTPSQTVTDKVTQKINSNIDILFMIDNSSSMTSMQQKLLTQLPTFMQVLQALPMGLPSVHVAVVSSDMGAPSDSDIGCSQSGDNGKFFVTPQAPCTSVGFTDPNAMPMFITDDAAGATKNFTAADPAGIATVFQCIGLLGANGCGFEHQLASIDHALGADNFQPDPQTGLPVPTPPASNGGFLRPDAYLGIVMLTNEDDCSAPASGGALPIFSLNGAQVNDINTPAYPNGPADGPIANYRCNGGPLGGHFCKAPDGTLEVPPINPPAGATTLTMTDCVDNDAPGNTSGLIPVSKFVSDIKMLKTDPVNQILVAAVTGVNGMSPNATLTPYTVEWVPPVGAPASTNGQLWPQIEHVCGDPNTGDKSFADPAVRIAQFVNEFGANGVLYSICDPSYAASMAAIAAKIGALITPKCITGTIQQDANGHPNCTVINEIKVNGMSTTTQVPVNACVDSATAPCWSFLAATDPMNKCGAAGQALSVTKDPNNPNPDSLDSLIQCATCVPGVPTAGCPCTGKNDVAGCLCSAAAMPAGCK